MWTHRTIIVPAALVDAARQACALLAGAGGSGMFQTALSTDGAEPASHYISAGPIEQQFADLLDAGTPAIVAAAESMQVQIDPAVIDALLAAADISQESADDAMGRMGLACVIAETGVENV